MARLESRRRARQAAIPPRVGACSLRSGDTWMGLPRICSLHGSGNPPNGSILVGGGKETKHGIPLVAASEMGKVQTESHTEICGRCRVKGLASSLLAKLKLSEMTRHRGWQPRKHKPERAELESQTIAPWFWCGKLGVTNFQD